MRLTHKPSRLCLALLLAWFPTWFATRAAADEVALTLAGGGEVRGKLLNPSEFPRTQYQIQSDYGVRLAFARDLVHNVRNISDKQLEYEKLEPTYPDTLDGQWALAEWCREKNMAAERQVHLRRVLDFNTDHEAARRALGFFRHEEVWTTQDELMTHRGFVKYKGEWVLPEEVAIRERRRQNELSEKAWLRQVSEWKKYIGSKPQEVIAQMDEVRDPNAVGAIAYHMAPDREIRPAVRQQFHKMLFNIGSPGAWDLIGEASLHDPDEDTRAAARERLEGQTRPDLVKKFVTALGSSDNNVVNRAALGLIYLKDDSAIGPLIDALVTTHKFRVVSGSPGTSATFGSNGGGGLSVGRRATVYHKPIANEPVRNALISLTGVNFGYGKEDWHTWHATYLRSRAVDTRRD